MDHQAHLIHVSSQHQGMCHGACPIFLRNQVPYGIDTDAAGVRGNILPDILPDRVLMAGDARKGTQCF